MSIDLEMWYILGIVQVTVLLTVELLLLAYLVPIICIQRFHTVYNVVTGNFCLASMACAGFYAFFKLVVVVDPMIFYRNLYYAVVNEYLQILVICLMVYALVAITINQCFKILYPTKRLFRRLTWSLLLVVIQWFVSLLLPAPALVNGIQVGKGS